MGNKISLFARNVAQIDDQITTTEVTTENLHAEILATADKVRKKSEDGPVIVSLDAPEPMNVTSVGQLPPPSTPPIPVATGLNWIPPQESTVVTVSSSPCGNDLYWNIADGPGGVYTGPYETVKSQFPNLAFKVVPFPGNALLIWKRYWKLSHSRTIVGKNEFTLERTVTEGTSETSQTEMAAEFGYSIEGLSASLSIRLSHSITVYSETETKTSYNYNIPEGKTAIISFWELIDSVWVYQNEEEVPFSMYNEEYTLNGSDWGDCQFLPCGFNQCVYTNAQIALFPS